MSNKNEKTDIIRQERHKSAKLDDVDRKILMLLSEDSSQSYAELSKILHLSAPAIHDRVKRLKKTAL